MIVEEIDQAIVVGDDLVVGILTAGVEPLALAVGALDEPGAVDAAEDFAVTVLQLDDEDRVLLEQHHVDGATADAEVRQDQVQPVEAFQPIGQRHDRAPLVRMFRLLADPYLYRHRGPPIRGSTYVVSRSKGKPFQSG